MKDIEFGDDRIVGNTIINRRGTYIRLHDKTRQDKPGPNYAMPPKGTYCCTLVSKEDRPPCEYERVLAHPVNNGRCISVKGFFFMHEFLTVQRT